MKINESILVIDIGGGTQDILVYDPGEPMENAVKLVAPSPTVIAARRIAQVTAGNRALFLSGQVMGGGAVSKAVRNHIKSGLKVYSLEGPALTLHDNPEKVMGLGVRIIDQKPENNVVEVILGDLDLKGLETSLAAFEVALPKIVALAIQDHGYSPRASNRLLRFSQWLKFLEGGGDIGALFFTSVPEGLTRWQAAAGICPGAYFMDTGSAALRGAMLDEYSLEHLDQGLVVVNAGNEHTVAFLVKGRRVWGVYEHHTSLLDGVKLADHISRFSLGKLTQEEIFDEWGHGVAYQPGYAELAPFRPVVITGPRRELARGLGHMAAPWGEMMLSGCFGLVTAIREHLEKQPG